MYNIWGELSLEYYLGVIVCLLYYVILAFKLLELFFGGYEKENFLFVLKSVFIPLGFLILNKTLDISSPHTIHFIISAIKITTEYILGLYIITFIALIIEFIFKKLKLL